MNYQKIMDQLIFKRKFKEPLQKRKDNIGKIEQHHILMRSIGGANNEENLVNLTVKEHYFIHELLVRIYRGTKYEKAAIRAWNGMSRKMGKRTKTSRLYQLLREIYNKQAGDSVRGKICINNGKKNKYILPNKKIPEGFVLGTLLTEKRSKHIEDLKTINTGKIMVTNGKEDIMVYPNEIPDGYVKGSFREGINKGKIFVNNGIKQLIVYPNEIPKGYTEGVLPLSGEDLIQKSNKTKKQWKSYSKTKRKKIGKKISKSMKGKIPWSKGKNLSNRHKTKIGLGNKGKKRSKKVRSEMSKRQKGKIKVNNGQITIYADPNNIPEGFVKGQIWKNPNKKRTSTNGYKKMINKFTKKSLYVKPEDIEEYRDNGYIFPSEQKNVIH